MFISLLNMIHTEELLQCNMENIEYGLTDWMSSNNTNPETQILYFSLLCCE